RRPSEIAELPGGGGELVAVARVGDGDQRGGALADRPAPQLGDTPLRHDVVDGVLDGGDNVASSERRTDLGGALAGGRVQHHETLAALGVHGAPGEVGLTTARRVVAP